MIVYLPVKVYTYTHTHTRMHTVVVHFLETGCGTEDSTTSLQSEKCPQETVRAVFAGIHTLLDTALRQPSLKLEVSYRCACSVPSLSVLWHFFLALT